MLGGPYTARELVTQSVRVGVFVPLGELQALLPPGFLAIAVPAGSDTALVFLNFFFQTRMERPGVGAGFGNFGPYSSLQIQTSVRNPENVAEGFFWLANLVSNPDVVSLQTSIFGPGSSRAATLKFEIEEKKGSCANAALANSQALFVVQGDNAGSQPADNVELSTTLGSKQVSRENAG